MESNQVAGPRAYVGKGDVEYNQVAGPRADVGKDDVDSPTDQDVFDGDTALENLKRLADNYIQTKKKPKVKTVTEGVYFHRGLFNGAKKSVVLVEFNVGYCVA